MNIFETLQKLVDYWNNVRFSFYANLNVISIKQLAGQAQLINDQSILTTRTMYQRAVDVDMLNAVKSVLADASSDSPSKKSSCQ